MPKCNRRSRNHNRRPRKLNMGDTDVALEIIRREIDQPTHGAEIGVHRGETSAKLLRAFPGLHLLMVDAWATYPSDHPYRKSGDGCSKLTQAQQDTNLQATYQAVEFAGSRTTIIRATSVEAGEQYPRLFGRLRLDFVVIDDDHTREGVERSTRAWWHTIRPGGIMFWHDVGHPRDRRGVWGVTAAAVAHCEREGLEWIIEGEVGWAMKPAEEDEEEGAGEGVGAGK